MRVDTENRITGGAALIRTLEQLGAEYVFGIPGGAALPIFDALYNSKLKFILVRHEQSAVHMADGYARATGKPAVVLVTSGPGATNTLTGIYTAFMDSVPMIVLCGQVGRAAYGKDSFQEVDIFAMSTPIVKHSYSLQNTNEICKIIEDSWHICQTGRPGPILVDLPKDLMEADCAFQASFRTATKSPYYPESPKLFSQRREADAIIQYLGKSNRPLLLVGHGAVLSRADEELLKFAEKLKVPVASTLLGKGAFPETHPLSLGMLGMHGNAYANLALTRCDLICSIGSRWDDRINGDNKNFCKNAIKIHIDIDPAEISKIVHPHESLIGDAREMLKLLNELLETSCVGPLDTSKWLAELENHKQEYPLTYPSEGGLKPQEILAKLDQLTQGKIIATSDVGQHQMWAAQFLRFSNSFRWVSSGGAGTMGFGFPAALGCQLGRPELPVFAVVGDGGFQMTSAELATAARYKLPVKILVLDNKYLGMVRQWQEMFYENRLSASDLSDNPDFIQLATAYGIKAFRLSDSTQVEKVLREALEYNSGPCLIHAEVEKQEDVFPMVPAGQSAEKMLIHRHHSPTPISPCLSASPQNQNSPISQEAYFKLNLVTRRSQNFFMRIAFVLSKKMYSLSSYEVQSEDHSITTIKLEVKGPETEIYKLIKLIKRLVGVLDVVLERAPIQETFHTVSNFSMQRASQLVAPLAR